LGGGTTDDVTVIEIPGGIPGARVRLTNRFEFAAGGRAIVPPAVGRAIVCVVGAGVGASGLVFTVPPQLATARPATTIMRAPPKRSSRPNVFKP
jgi:hypothetical protein